MAKVKYGHMACPDCGTRVSVRVAEGTETLSYRCDECDGGGYCKKGEGRYPLWLGKITRLEAPSTEPARAPAKEPAKAPAFRMPGAE